MNTIYLIYIFGETDVGLLFLLTEKQNTCILCVIPIYSVPMLGLAGYFYPSPKIYMLETVHNKT